MKVVLIKNIPAIGKIGEVKEVKDGYAKNFLIPNKLAEKVSNRKVEDIKDRKKKEEKKKKNAVKNRSKLASKINGKLFKFSLNSDETGTLYIKLNSKYIAEKIKKEGFDITTKEINLAFPIKKIGEYDVELRIGDAKPKIKILINK